MGLPDCEFSGELYKQILHRHMVKVVLLSLTSF
jgi:hypothetical protein